MQIKEKIFIGIPTMSYVHTLLMSVIIRWFTSGKYNLHLFTTINEQPVDEARNKIVAEFLKTDCTHLLFIDDDTIPPENALDKLLEANRTIVSALTPMIRLSKETGDFFRQWNCVDMKGVHLNKDTGIVPIIGAGGACLLIKRIVLEKMQKPYFRNTYKDDSGKDTFVGEDIYFITKAHSIGYQAYADTSIICKHFKPTLW